MARWLAVMVAGALACVESSSPIKPRPGAVDAGGDTIDPQIDAVISSDDVPTIVDIVPNDEGAPPEDPGTPDAGMPAGPCVVAKTLACGESVTGSTGGAASAISTYGCGLSDDYSGSGEVTYAFTASSATTATFAIAGDSTEHKSLDLFVMAPLAGGGCDPQACDFDGSSVTLSIPAGATRYVTLDSYEGEAGEFTLTAACCTPSCGGKACGGGGCGPPGASCAGLPTGEAGSPPSWCLTCGECAGNELCTPAGTCMALPEPVCQPLGTLGCNGKAGGALDGEGSTETVFQVSCVGFDYSGPEKAWTIDVPAGTTVTAKVTTQDDEDDEIDVAVLASESGACNGDDCEAQSQSAATVKTEAGMTYVALVLAYEGTVKDFELTITCCEAECAGKACGDDGCGGTCGACKGDEVCAAGACKVPTFDGNDTCETAAAVGALPFAASGTTIGAKNDYTFAGDACGEGQKGGLDVVFAYHAPATQSVSAWLDDYGFGAPKILYVLTDCGDAASCVAEKDFFAAAPGDTLTVAVEAGETAWFVVDGYDGSEKGAYGFHLEVSKP